MRKIYILLFTLMAAWSLIGCTRENLEQTDGNGEVLIRLKVDAIQTKSAGTADENYVESLQVLVFKDITAAPAKYVNLTSEITAGETTYEKEYTSLTDFGGFTPDELTNATVFAVANYSGDLNGVASLAAAKELAVNADGFIASSSAAGGIVVKPEPRFIMIAEGGFTRDGATNKAVADLTLTRLAAKVSLIIKYDDTGTNGLITTEDTVAGTTTVWTPMAEGNVRVYLENAVNNGKLGGDPADTQVRFRYADDHPAGEGTLSSSPFYTYPASWTEGSQDAPFLKLIQPWSYKTIKNNGTDADPVPVIIDQNVVELYYKIMLPGVTELTGNMWYQPTVTLNVLGGESSRNMTDLTPTGFDILPWGNVGSTAGGLSPIAIDPAKYLAVERDVTVVNNGGGVSIKYVASGSVTWTVKSIYKEVFVNDGETTKYIYDPDDTNISTQTNPDLAHHCSENVIDYYSASWFTNTYPSTTDPDRQNEGTITLNHTLSAEIFDSHGDRISNFAARPYHYVINLHLDSEGLDTTLDREFTIIQNPSLLADGQMSTGWVCINGIDAINASASYGNTHTAVSGLYTNGYQPRTSSAYTAPYVRLAGNKADSDHHAYISTKVKASAYNAQMQAVNNLGTIHTYNYQNPTGGNASRWRILVRPTSKAGMYIMDPRINISSDTGHELYKLLHTHTTDFGNTAAASNFIDGTPLFADGSSAATYTDFKKYTPAGNADEFRAVIAPEVMFASSYGKTTSLNYFASLLRCAAYQEDGYPAGRWRLPTEEEIELAIDLNTVGAIPALFNTTGKYWASSGRYISNSGGTWSWTAPTNAEMTFNTNSGSYSMGVRCVYDTWYWGQDEVTALRTSDYQSNYNNPQYNWSGYGYTTK